jgi:hypothetical protein
METNAHELQPMLVPRGDLDADKSPVFVNSSRFIEQLTQAETLKLFLFKEKALITEEQLKAIDLDGLNNLIYKADGRIPTPDEWRTLDEKHSALIACLDIQLRRKLRVRELDFFFGFLPMTSLGVCATVTVIYMIYNKLVDPTGTLATFIFTLILVVWTISQGALGACAFLGTSVLGTRTVEVTTVKSGETRPTATTDEIDITDPSVLKIRVLSGALFAFLIGLPFSYQALDIIGTSIFTPRTPESKIDILQLGLIFVPFIVGFSTNFVLAVLNRIIASLQILLGMTSRIQ